MAGIAGGTDQLPTEIGVLNDSQQLGFSATYPAGTGFTASDGVQYQNWDEIRLSVDPMFANNLDTLSYIDIQASDMDGLIFSLPSTVVTSVNLCPADLNNDGNLNFLDVSAFLAAFGDQNSIADFTGEGNFNFLDVSAFLAEFGAGCP
jgi:hypothetical protein